MHIFLLVYPLVCLFTRAENAIEYLGFYLKSFYMVPFYDYANLKFTHKRKTAYVNSKVKHQRKAAYKQLFSDA